MTKDRRPRRETQVIPDIIFEKFMNSTLGYLEDLIAHLFRNTPLRRIDIAQLKMEQLDLIGKWIRVKEQQKTKTLALIPLNESTIKVFKSYHQFFLKGKQSGYIFPSNKGRKNGFMSPRQVSNIFNRICERAGFEKGFITPHDCRTTFFTKAKVHNIPESMLSQISGTSLGTIMKHYTKFNSEEIKENISKIQN